MVCCGRRGKEVEPSKEQTWDHIILSDFKSTSCLTPFSYGILYISLLVSIAIYGVDVFVAVNLLAFNRWSGQVKPVKLEITKWIFAACIILSLLNLAFEWTRATRVMKRGVVAESYLDPLAVRVQSVRMGKRGRGWRRFLVFAELTKSKKGVEYVALFTYFSFQAWFRVIFAEGPRVIVNALTLWKVMQANLIPKGEDAVRGGHSPFVQFWVNIGILADSSKQQALILSGMTFTLVIWVISALNLIIACIMYLLFLWHYIPASDGGLTGFLKRKTDRKVSQIMAVKVQKALDKEEETREKEEAKAIKAGAPLRQVKREPTLPLLTGQSTDSMSMLSHNGTTTTLPPYPSRPPTSHSIDSPLHGREPAVPDVGLIAGSKDRKLSPPNRALAPSPADSTTSLDSNAPLTRNAGPPGYGTPGARTPGTSPPLNQPYGYGNPPGPNRGPRPPQGRGPPAAWGGPPGPQHRGPPQEDYFGPPSARGPPPRQGPPPFVQPGGPYNRGPPPNQRGPPPQNRMGTAPPFGGPPIPQQQQNPYASDPNTSYRPSQAPPPRPNGGGMYPPQQAVRNFTAPNPPPSNNFGHQQQPYQPPRAGTAPPPASRAYDDSSLYDGYGSPAPRRPGPGPGPPPRSATAGALGGGYAQAQAPRRGGPPQQQQQQDWSGGYGGGPGGF